MTRMRRATRDAVELMRQIAETIGFLLMAGAVIAVYSYWTAIDHVLPAMR